MRMPIWIFYRAVCIQIAAFLIIRCFCKPHYGADTFGKLDRKEKGVERKAGRLSECAFDWLIYAWGSAKKLARRRKKNHHLSQSEDCREGVQWEDIQIPSNYSVVSSDRGRLHWLADGTAPMSDHGTLVRTFTSQTIHSNMSFPRQRIWPCPIQGCGPDQQPSVSYSIALDLYLIFIPYSASLFRRDDSGRMAAGSHPSEITLWTYLLSGPWVRRKFSVIKRALYFCQYDPSISPRLRLRTESLTSELD